MALDTALKQTAMISFGDCLIGEVIPAAAVNKEISLFLCPDISLTNSGGGGGAGIAKKKFWWFFRRRIR